MNFITQSLIIIFVSLLYITTAFAAEWDGKSPIWVGGVACNDKIYFSVMDKMSTAKEYKVEYRVWFTSENRAYVLNKSYTTNSADVDAVFPDDFYENRLYERTGKYVTAPSPCATEKIFWATYVNGKRISDGVISRSINHTEVNGKLISTKRK